MNCLKYTITYFLILGLFASCSTQPKKRPPIKSSTAVIKLFRSARNDFKTKKFNQAISKFNRLVQEYPLSDLSPDSYIFLGKIYIQSEEFSKAEKSFLSVINGPVLSLRENEAVINLGDVYLETGNYDKLLSLVKRYLKETPEKSFRISLKKMRFFAFKKQGRALEELITLIDLYNESEGIPKNQYKFRALNIVEMRLQPNELEYVAGNSKFKFAQYPSMFRLAEYHFNLSNFGKARSLFQNVISRSEEGDFVERSTEYMNLIDSREKVDPMTIGAILPLSGKYSRIGYKALQGIQLALGIYGNENSPIKLAVFDSQGSPILAKKGVEKLVTEDHCIAIIGSIMAKTADAVAQTAQSLNVPNISLSQRANLTDNRNYVFRNALTSEIQVRYLVQKAIREQGLKRFAILYPNDRYGVEFANFFWDEVLANGGEIKAAQAYLPDETDFRKPIQRMVGTYYLDDRYEEYKLRLLDWNKRQKSRSAVRNPPKDILPPIVDFDAVFIPDSTKALGQIAPMLAFNDVTEITLLGTNLWNTSDLIERAGKFVSAALFVDSHLNTDLKFISSKFNQSYQNVFSEEPQGFEIMAYDSAHILKTLILDGYQSRSVLRQKLSEFQAIQGAVGPVSFLSTREADRPLIALTVRGGKIVKHVSSGVNR